MAGAPDAPSPNLFGKPSAKRPKRSRPKAVKRYHQYFRDILLAKETIKIR
jgi:hypothetical protein